MKRQSKLWGVSAILSIAALLAGCGGERDEATTLASARSYLETKQHAAAIVELKSLLQAHPESAEGRFLLGKGLLATGDAAGAEAEFSRALERGFPEKSLAVPLATALLALGRSQELIDRYHRMDLDGVEEGADLKTQVALAYAETGDTAKAAEVVAVALRRAPAYAPARLLDARLKAAGGEPTESLAIAEQVLAQEPENAQAWLLKGDLLQQDYPGSAESEAAYRQALLARADLLPALRALVAMRISQRDLEGARKEWAEMAKALPRHPQTMYYEALIAYLEGDAKRTREITQLLVRGSPENASVLLLAGQAATQLGALAEAETLLLRAMAAAPKAAEPRRALAVAYLRGGQANKALAILDFLASLIDSPRSEDGESLALAAQAYLLLGDFRKADATFERAARLLPDDRQLRVARARARLGRGQDDQPLSELAEIAAIDRGPSADLALISARLQRQEWEAALRAVDSLAEKLPTSPLPDHLRGAIAWKRHDPAGARRGFELALAKDPRYFPSVQGMVILELEENKPEAARQRIETLLQNDPKNVPAMIVMADWMVRTGAPAKQINELLERAAATRPNDPATHLAIIDHHLRAGDPTTALTAARAAVVALPSEAVLLERLGSLQLAAGDTNQAITTLATLVRAIPKSAAARLRLADAYLVAGKTDEAEDQLRLALRVDPTSLPAQRANVAMAVRQKNPAKALQLARSLQSQFPNDALGFRLEGNLEASRKNWGPAASAFRKALVLDSAGDAPERLHWVLGAAGKAAEATQFERAWLKEHPRDAGFIVHLADMAMLRSDWPAAEDGYRQVLELQPENALAMNNLAYLLVQLKKPGALPLAERAVALAPGRPEMLDTLALVHAEAKQFDQAIAAQRKAVSLAPDSPGLRLALARLYLQAGDKEKARTELASLAKRGKSFSGHDEVVALLKQADQ